VTQLLVEGGRWGGHLLPGRTSGACAHLHRPPLVRLLLRDTVANVCCPAVKLWNTGYGATMLREAVSFFGEEGLTEDCPGFPSGK